MKILLQDTETKLYLGRGGNWTDIPEGALAFLDEVRAKNYSIYRRLAHTQVFMLPETAATTPATANTRRLTNESTMNATKNTEQTDRPVGTNNNRFPSIEEALVKSQVVKIAKEEKEAKTIAPKNKRTTSPKPSPKATIVEAKVDVGFGNSLFIRGQGAELSWDKGLPLICIDGSTWVWSTTRAKDKLVFKLVLNDQVWAQGEDVVLEPGKTVKIVPAF